MCGYNNPCNSVVVRRVLEAGCRILATCIVKKEPITATMLKALVVLFPVETCNRLSCQTLVMFIIGYAGFFRFSELIGIRRNHIQFYEQYFTIFVPSSKTDQIKTGHTVTIAKTGNCTCPFKVLTAYLQKGHMFNLSERYIFRKLVFRKKSDEYVFKDEGKMSYTRCRELLKEKLSNSWGGCEEILFTQFTVRWSYRGRR